MAGEMTLQFNIVYTPGTVKYLSLFVHSLLKWSDCSYRLVSNGCLPAERRFLERMSRQSPRLEYWAIPTKHSVPHGQALNYLQGMCRSDYFCFMDSDIFATGEFLSQLAPYDHQYAGVFSATPVWLHAHDAVLPETFQIMSGLHTRTDHGVCLGSTYFAIYYNQTLSSLIQATGVGFEEYSWDEVPAQYQDQLTRMGLAKRAYDTGKLLNLLLIAHGEQLNFVNSPALCHIGGTSFVALYDAMPETWKARLVSRLIHTGLQPLLRPILERRRSRAAYRAYRTLSPAEYRAIVSQRQRQRDPTRRYFFKLLGALFDDEPLPEVPSIGDVEIEARIELATREIIALYEEFGQKHV